MHVCVCVQLSLFYHCVLPLRVKQLLNQDLMITGNTYSTATYVSYELEAEDGRIVKELLMVIKDGRQLIALEGVLDSDILQ